MQKVNTQNRLKVKVSQKQEANELSRNLGIKTELQFFY